MTLGGARRGYVKQGYTARDYVQDGLIAMYDGIENAGFGRHDSVSCKNLMSDKWHGTVGADVVITENAFVFDGQKRLSSAIALGGEWFGKPEEITAEVCFVSENATSFSSEAVFGGTENHASGITFWHNTVQYGRDGDSVTVSLGFSWRGDRVKRTISLCVGEIGEVFVSGERIKSSSYKLGWNRQVYPCYIGCDAYAPVEYPIDGKVFCVRIYSRALSAPEVAVNYAIDKARFNLPD